MYNQKQTRREFFKFSGLTILSLTQLSRIINVNTIRVLFDDDDGTICKKKFTLFVDEGLKDKAIGDAIVEIGKSFLGTEYVAGTLEINAPAEKLVVNLTGLDCVTFVENCLTFARCLKKRKTTFDAYKNELEYIRYRDGKIDGYASRLNYFCDWIFENENKGIVKNISADLGGIEYNKTINFMSTHTKSYKQLSDKTELDGIIAAEEAINSRYHYYIPKKSISKIYDQLQNGDIIATTTTIAGLDVTHTGYVYKGDDGGTYFLHASSKSKEVIISQNQLAEYIAEDSKKTGIMVVRPVEI
jgi:hypothetical protein